MDGTRHTCLAGCGRSITWRFAICSSCEEIYGNSSIHWPAWLSFLWNSEQRLRRQDKRIREHELSMSDIGESSQPLIDEVLTDDVTALNN
jgi:hypothetical protein